MFVLKKIITIINYYKRLTLKNYLDFLKISIEKLS